MNNSTTKIGIRVNFVNFIQIILINVSIAIIVHSLTQNKRLPSNYCTEKKKMIGFMFGYIKLSGVLTLLTTKEVFVPMHTMFKTLGEIHKFMILILKIVKIG